MTLAMFSHHGRTGPGGKEQPPSATGELRGHVLVVDDENGPRQSLRILLKEDHDVFLASDADAALKVLDEQVIDLIITDLRMPRKSGVELLQSVKETCPDVEVIILTGYGQLSSAMKAVEFGAFAYLEKPFDTDKVVHLVRAGIQKRRRELERQQLEKLALDANRFGTFNWIVSGLIHDLGTPLSVIGNHIELLLLDPGKDNLEERLGILRAQVQYCCDIIRSTMNFLRQRPDRPALLNLNEVVETCLEVAQPLLRKHNVTVVEALEKDLPPLTGDFVLVRQAVLNLIVNACQAMEEQSEPRELSFRSSGKGSTVSLSVGDTGPGIPAEDRERIFESFFSTKSTVGTGLGLAVIKHVMDQHGGEVTLRVKKTRGSLFTLQFPVAESEPV